MAQKSRFVKGKLIRWKDERGFGFIELPGNAQEVFIHISELKDATRRPKVGDIIYFYAVEKENRLQAKNAFILGARDGQSTRIAKAQEKRNRDIRGKFSSLAPIILLMLIPLIGTFYLAQQHSGSLIFLLIYPSVSYITYFLYAHDKSCAQTGKWRIPEQSLHIAEFVGGWPGGFVAQRMLRHKNRKKSYQLLYWGIVISHQVGWLIACFG